MHRTRTQNQVVSQNDSRNRNQFQQKVDKAYDLYKKLPLSLELDADSSVFAVLEMYKEKYLRRNLFFRSKKYPATVKQKGTEASFRKTTLYKFEISFCGETIGQALTEDDHKKTELAALRALERIAPALAKKVKEKVVLDDDLARSEVFFSEETTDAVVSLHRDSDITRSNLQSILRGAHKRARESGFVWKSPLTTALSLFCQKHLKVGFKFLFRVPGVSSEVPDDKALAELCFFSAKCLDSADKVAVLTFLGKDNEVIYFSSGVAASKQTAKLAAVQLLVDFLNKDSDTVSSDANLTEELYRTLTVIDPRIALHQESFRPNDGSFKAPKVLACEFVAKALKSQLADVAEFKRTAVTEGCGVELSFGNIRTTGKGRTYKLAEAAALQALFATLLPEIPTYFELVKFVTEGGREMAKLVKLQKGNAFTSALDKRLSLLLDNGVDNFELKLLDRVSLEELAEWSNDLVN